MRATRAFECVMMLSIAITSTFPWRWFLASFMLDETSSFTSAQTQTQTYRQGGLHSQTYAYLQRLAQRHPFPAPQACTRIHTTLTHTEHLHTTLTYTQHWHTHNTCISTTLTYSQHINNTYMHATRTYTQHWYTHNTYISTTLTYTQHWHTHNTYISTTLTYTQHLHTHKNMHAYKHCLAHYYHHPNPPPHASPPPPPHLVRVVSAYCVSLWHHFRLQRSTRLQSAQLLLFHSLVSLHFGVARRWQWKKFDCLVWFGWLVELG